MINIDKLFELMSREGFQEPRAGNLFFPAYIYTYSAQDEYELRDKINKLDAMLKRPNLYLSSMVVNIFHELIEYLRNEEFAGRSLLDSIIDKEKEDAEEAFDWLREEVNEGEFYAYFSTKVKEYFKTTSNKRVYLIIYGFGSAFPFLRASDFLKNTESLVKDFKLILFYPGEYKENNYSLFSELNDENMYRANYLNRLLGEYNN